MRSIFGEMNSLACFTKMYVFSFGITPGQILNLHPQVWEKYGIDGIIAPVQAIPQLPHGYVYYCCLLYLDKLIVGLQRV